MLKSIRKYFRERRIRSTLLRLSKAEGAVLVEQTSAVLSEFPIERLHSGYLVSRGELIRVEFFEDPIQLLESVEALTEAIKSNGYLPPTFGVNDGIKATTFDGWYEHNGASIRTLQWYPRLCKEVATLATVMRGAEVCALDKYSYYIRRSKMLQSDLKTLVRALLDLGG